MGGMGVEEEGDGEAEGVDGGGIGAGDIEDAEWDHDAEEIREKNRLDSGPMVVTIIHLPFFFFLLFEPLMIPYWDGGYMGGKCLVRTERYIGNEHTVSRYRNIKKKRDTI